MQNVLVSRVRCDPTRPFVEIQADPALIGRANQNSAEDRTEVHLGWDLTNRMWVLKGERQRH